MNSEKNQQLLISILASFSKTTFTVIEVRDELLNQASFSATESAKTRRWIAGKFVTFERWGWLERINDPLKNRDYFKVLPKMHDDNKKEESQMIKHTDCSPPTDSAVLKSISQELEQYRKAIITQMSEIEEYKRIEHAYPELKGIATHRFQLVRDENYRLLGKMKALEHLMTGEKEQSQS